VACRGVSGVEPHTLDSHVGLTCDGDFVQTDWLQEGDGKGDVGKDSVCWCLCVFVCVTGFLGFVRETSDWCGGTRQAFLSRFKASSVGEFVLTGASLFFLIYRGNFGCRSRGFYETRQTQNGPGV